MGGSDNKNRSSLNAYQFADVCIESEIAFPELTRTERSGRYRIRIEPAIAPVRQRSRPIWACPGVTVQRLDNDYLFTLGSAARYRVSPKERCIFVQGRGAAPNQVRHEIADQLMPRMLSHEGRLVLHASGVSTPEGALLCLGASGAGKSTLAASLSLMGASVMSDDGIAIEPHREHTFVAAGLYPSLRLFANSQRMVFGRVAKAADLMGRKQKSRLQERDTGRPFSHGKKPISGIVLLCPQAEPQRSVEVLRGADAAVAIMQHAFVLDAFHRLSLGRRFATATKLVRHQPVLRLKYAKTSTSPQALAHMVLESVRGVAVGCRPSRTCSLP